MRTASSREQLNILNHTLELRSAQRDPLGHFYKKNSTPTIERNGKKTPLRNL